MRTVNEDRIAVTPGRVVELMCSPAFLERAHGARDDVAEARYVDLGAPEGERVFEVLCDQYERHRTGGVDRSRTRQTSLRYHLQADGRTLTWVYDGPDADRVHIRGVTTVTEDGDVTVVREVVHIDMDIPLIGGLIARLVARDMGRTFDANRAVVREMLAQTS